MKRRAGLVAGFVVVGLSACGGSSPTAPPGSTAGTPPAGAPTAGTPTAAHVSASVQRQEKAIHRQVRAALHHTSRARYGALPADLRHRQKAPPQRAISSSLARPADPIQGVSVHLRLDGATALATGLGPLIPTRVQGTFDLHTPATWRVVFTQVRGRFPLAASLFTLTDEQGQVLRPRVTTGRGRPLPAFVPAGRPFTVRLRSDLIAEGDGKLRYAPVAGRLLVEWDFDVETD